MKARQNNSFQRSDTRYSKDGCTVFVRLRVDRRSYEFARSWARFHAKADPSGTAEVHLEGYLNMTLLTHMLEQDWIAPSEIEALYPRCVGSSLSDDDFDDEIPF